MQSRKLLQSRADPTAADYDGRTALHVAASRGHAEAVGLRSCDWCPICKLTGGQNPSAGQGRSVALRFAECQSWARPGLGALGSF